MIKAETLSAEGEEGKEGVLSERDESLFFSSCLLRRSDRLLSRRPTMLLELRHSDQHIFPFDVV